MGIIGCLRLRAALLYVGFSLQVSFTTCFSLLGHLQVCTCLLIFKEPASLLFGYVVLLCRVKTNIKQHADGNLAYNTH
jgi:hypothetical protein